MQESQCMILCFVLMLLTGLVYYYLYLHPEQFLVSSTITTPYCECAATQPIFNSIISKFSGIGINVTQVTLQTGNNQQLYLINTIPINTKSVTGSVYAVDNSNYLTTVIQNMNDSNQYWTITPTTDSRGILVNIVSPYIQKVSGIQFALQYESGNLALRPLDESFESQHWLTSTTKFNVGIPIIAVNPASIYTPEFAQTGNFTPGSGVSTSLDSQNNQQVNNVINLIQAGVQQYMTQLNNTTNGTGNTSSSSLGNSGNPLNINVDLSGGVKSLSHFTDISNSTGGSALDVIGLLNQYEQEQNPINYDDYKLYRKGDLESALQGVSALSSPDPRDYISKTISTCNCKM